MPPKSAKPTAVDDDGPTPATLTDCPDCRVTGADVYRAAAHPTTCQWMMKNLHRCTPHDELLRPDESTCPAPDVAEEAFDPHNRRGMRAKDTDRA